MKKNGMIFRRLMTLLPFCLLLAVSPQVAAAQLDASLQADLQSLGPETSVPVIITFAEEVHPIVLNLQGRTQQRAALIRSKRFQADSNLREMRALLGPRATTGIRPLWLINALAATATPEVIRRFAGMPGVVSVRRDRLYHKEDLLMALTDAPEENILQVGAPAVWAVGHFGQGVTIGLMDSGADLRHPDLTPTWRGGTNSWLDPYSQYAAPFDSDTGGHGTGVLGIMVGTDRGGTTIGVAPKARWIAARMFDNADTVTDSVIHQIFQWFLDPDGNPATDDAPDVINASWSLNQPGVCIDEFQADITALNAAGIATVFAAGNYGPNAATSVSPANNAGAIAVGAVNSADLVGAFSSRGPSVCDGRVYPDVMAPGVSIKTTDRSFGGLLNYAISSGTSFATPHASGALALMSGAFPQADLDNLKTALKSAAVDLGFPGPDNDYGNGRINADDVGGAFSYLKDTLGLTACVRPEITLSATPYPGSIGQPVTFTATASGGPGPFTFEWDVNGDGAPDYTTSTPDSSVQHTYSAAYTGSVGLTVTDASPSACASSLIIADQWACPILTASISADPNPGVIGAAVVFGSTVSGGTAPYTYAWDLDANGSIDCATDTCNKTYSAEFSGTITLTITDSTGCSASAQTPFNIPPPTPTPAPANGGSGGGGGCFIGTFFEYFR